MVSTQTLSWRRRQVVSRTWDTQTVNPQDKQITLNFVFGLN